SEPGKDPAPPTHIRRRSGGRLCARPHGPGVAWRDCKGLFFSNRTPPPGIGEPYVSFGQKAKTCPLRRFRHAPANFAAPRNAPTARPLDGWAIRSNQTVQNLVHVS